MAKFYGKVGFEELSETSPSVYTPTIIERAYSGDLVRNYRKFDSGEGINDDLNISNEVSIVADPYALNHFHTLKYVLWHGARWKVIGITEEFPRLRLTIGGVYNGPTPTD